MADASFLFKQKTTLSKSETGLSAIVFDASLTEVYKTSANVTEFPVESGAVITDHIQTRPIEIEIVGVISNTPIPFIHKDPSVLRSFITPNRAEDAYDKLVELQKSGELVTLATTLDSFDNLAIVSLQLDRDPQTANAVKVRISLKEIKRAASLAADLAKTASKNLKKAQTGAKAAAKSLAKPANVGFIKSFFNFLKGGR